MWFYLLTDDLQWPSFWGHKSYPRKSHLAKKTFIAICAGGKALSRTALILFNDMHWELVMCKVLWQKLKLKWEQKIPNVNIISALKIQVKEKRHVNRARSWSVWGVVFSKSVRSGWARTQERQVLQETEGFRKGSIETSDRNWILKEEYFSSCVCWGVAEGAYCISEEEMQKLVCRAEGWHTAKWFTCSITDSAAGP